MSNSKYRVVLCDDHSIVRAGIKGLVEGFADFEVIGDVESGEALFPLFRSEVPDVLLLDISLPGRSGLEVLKQVKS
ncbi:MAG: response regulator transcription factor, partial [Flavobacteriales bacterium]|nr:response regulator transcription factor [Flavobacteriales bacterium]